MEKIFVRESAHTHSMYSRLMLFQLFAFHLLTSSWFSSRAVCDDWSTSSEETWTFLRGNETREELEKALLVEQKECEQVEETLDHILRFTEERDYRKINELKYKRRDIVRRIEVLEDRIAKMPTSSEELPDFIYPKYDAFKASGSNGTRPFDSELFYW